jgi:uncharacterized Zn finger protein (UPF0148 family)
MSAYWYKYTTYYCPVCGHQEDYKERVYDRPKPEEYSLRHEFKESYDYCMEWESVMEVMNG